MSHELTRRTDGTYEMAYAGNTPWHGLGEKLDPSASREVWLKAAGMDFTIQRAKVRYATAHGQDAMSYMVMDGQEVLLRSDNKAALGIVSDGYKVVQPRVVLDTTYDLCESVGIRMETAGTLFGGKKMWALANIGDEALIVPGDKVGGYFLLSTSCDGSAATQAFFTAIRVVCNNTIRMAESAAKGKKQYKVSHKTVFDPAMMRVQLGIAHSGFAKFVEEAKVLANTDLHKGVAEEMTQNLLLAEKEEPSLADELDKVRESLAFKRITALFNGQGRGSSLEGVRGTAWGWLNAVTEYSDHHVRATSVDNRLQSAWFGAGDTLKTRALEMALEI